MLPEIRIAVRSGDTPARERLAMVRRPPHILITTPESLYILLTSARSREFLKDADTVILDEIHAVAADKRGAHLALSVERLNRLVNGPLQRIGLSATQKPIEEVARLLVGSRSVRSDGSADCVVVDAGHKRDLDLRIEVPDEELGAIIRQGHLDGGLRQDCRSDQGAPDVSGFCQYSPAGRTSGAPAHGADGRRQRRCAPWQSVAQNPPRSRGEAQDRSASSRSRDRVVGTGHRHRPRRSGLSYRRATRFGDFAPARRPFRSLARRHSQRRFFIH
jgi:hypothetical protein